MFILLVQIAALQVLDAGALGGLAVRINVVALLISVPLGALLIIGLARFL